MSEVGQISQFTEQAKLEIGVKLSRMRQWEMAGLLFSPGAASLQRSCLQMLSLVCQVKGSPHL